jgi:hypothetical protein
MWKLPGVAGLLSTLSEQQQQACHAHMRARLFTHFVPQQY